MNEPAEVANPLLGAWRIERTGTWDDDDLDLLGEARIVFLEDELGWLRVGAMEAEIDCRARETPRRNAGHAADHGPAPRLAGVMAFVVRAAPGRSASARPWGRGPGGSSEGWCSR